MLNKIYSFLLRIVIYYKYKNKHFKFFDKTANIKKLNSQFPYSENIIISKNVHIGNYALLDGAGGITIGEGTIIAPNVTIYSRSHNFSDNIRALPFDDVSIVAEVNIGNYVWIGSHVIILPGVTIADGAIIGSGSVISKDIPNCAVVVGNPAKIIKHRDTKVFKELSQDRENFVYSKFGHTKKFKRKSLVADEFKK